MSSPRMLLCRRRSTPLPLIGNDKELEEVLVTGSRSEPVWPTVHIDDELNKESVFEFLRYNKELLEEYVIKEVSQDTLERWTIRKAKVIKKRSRKLDTVIPSSLSKWKFCVHTDKHHLMQDLAHSLTEESFILVLHKLCTAIQKAVLATTFHLYEYCSEKKLLVLVYNTELKIVQHPTLDVCEGDSIAGYVGWKRETIITSLLHERNDKRFPNGLGFFDKSSLAACSVLCLPILSITGELVAVLEMIRLAGEISFHEEEAEIAESYLSWAAVALQQRHCKSERCSNQRVLNEAVIKIMMFGIDPSYDIQAFLDGVVKQCADIVSGTRVVLYLQSTDRKDELYAAAKWDDEGGNLTALDRFPVSKGIAGYVFQNEKLINCSNALNDNHFNQRVDISIPECGSALLCMPLMVNGSTIGVMSVTRETSRGDFTADHECSLTQFCHYATLAYKAHKALDDGRLAEKHLEVTNQVLEYHRQCTDNDINNLEATTAITPDIAAQFPDLLFISSKLSTLHAVKASADMFMSLAGSLTHLFSHDMVLHFIMTVSKNYRPVAYHNWGHGFCVAQTMFAILQSSAGHFSDLEKVALFTACLCHDMDHRGYSNHFYTATNHPLAMLYSTSVLEQHHFRQTELLLGIKQLDIFCNLDPLTYKQVMKLIRSAILATDLSLFSGNMKVVQSLIASGTFDWNNTEHKAYALSIMMTACDVSSTTKPWDVHKNCVRHLLQEFYQQGDEEKNLGNSPLPVMNRENYSSIPLLQKEFVEFICIPCYSVLADLLPNTVPLLVSCRDNNQRWKMEGEQIIITSLCDNTALVT